MTIAPATEYYSDRVSVLDNNDHMYSSFSTCVISDLFDNTDPNDSIDSEYVVFKEEPEISDEFLKRSMIAGCFQLKADKRFLLVYENGQLQSLDFQNNMEDDDLG